MKIRHLTILFISSLAMWLPCTAFSQKSTGKSPKNETKGMLIGRVVESVAYRDLLKAKVYVNDSQGNHVDSLKLGGYYTGASGGGATEMARFSHNVPKVDSVYHYEVRMEGYMPYFEDVEIKGWGKREHAKLVHDFVLKKAPKELSEVTVKASKVKFFNRGDTLVYNADAFELAEGSMLDALIKQLPGVELKEGGQIYVNGEYVESLQLNGKDFFKGNNQLMLDNLAAYTVKNIEVYRRTSDRDKWAGVQGEKTLTMDVKLKKEYNQGWLGNFEAGGGTSERYMGRVFLSRFTNNSRVSFVGNINNLNDSRKPGEKSTWTPTGNNSGTTKTILGGLDYNTGNNRGTWKFRGNTIVRHQSVNTRTDVDRTNFLDGGNTYDYSFSRNKNRSFEANTANFLNLQNEAKYYTDFGFQGKYQKDDSESSYLGAVFNRERNGLVREDIEKLYSGGIQDLESVINRNSTSSLGSGHQESFLFDVNDTRLVPKQNDSFNFNLAFSYDGNKNETWRDYLINYGTDPTPAVRRNQYFDNSPNRTWSVRGTGHYQIRFSTATTLTFQYAYQHKDIAKDSYMYALDRLAEAGTIGTLPEGWLSTFDASGSYRSSTIENKHTLKVSFFHWGNNLNTAFYPTLDFIDRNFHYFRNNTPQKVDQKNVLFALPGGAFHVSFAVGTKTVNGRTIRRHSFKIQGSVVPTMPDPVKMVDVLDANDPLNLYVGNPDLKPYYKFRFNPRYDMVFPLFGRQVSNAFTPDFQYRFNELINGYTYDTSTGVRTNKTFNVKSGNYLWTLYDFLHYQFGNKGQFTVDLQAGVEYHHASDMIGINAEQPGKWVVHTVVQNHKLSFNWQIGQHRLGFNGTLAVRTTDSEQPGFKRIDAKTGNFALTGLFRLPKGFEMSTDFTLYVRRGYGAKELDTTDPVWNMRLAYTPPKSNWSFMVDGFDILHQLSSVHYAVSAQGRTITYTNVLPRYLMAHIQYRLAVKPKKKMITTFKTWDEINR